VLTDRCEVEFSEIWEQFWRNAISSATTDLPECQQE